MKVYTKRDAIKEGIKLFIAQWGNYPKGTYGADRRGINICRELQKLDPETVDAKIVNELIGTPSWTTNRCDGCQQEAETVAMIPIPWGADDDSLNLCQECLQGWASG